MPPAPTRAATDLMRAAFHLGAAEVGWTIGAGLGGDVIDPRLQAVFGQTYDILEMATMSLGFGNTMSALDLCADAVLLACGEPLQGDGRFYDVGDLRRRRQGRRLAASPALRAWIDQLLADPDLAELQDCRDHLIHRTPQRDITYRLDRRGLATTRELAEITTLQGGRPARQRGSIADLVPRLVGFGEDQLHDLCAAILTPRPTR